MVPFKSEGMGGDKGVGIRGVGLKLTKDVNLRRVEVLVEVVEGVVVVECE